MLLGGWNNTMNFLNVIDLVLTIFGYIFLIAFATTCILTFMVILVRVLWLIDDKVDEMMYGKRK